jgi:abortive infection bacteriophage resistance protein
MSNKATTHATKMPSLPPQQFLTYDQQLTHLASCGLEIPSDTFAKEKLSTLGYFTLIGGYKRPFFNPMTRRFAPGTTFDDIVALYQFDNQLRLLFAEHLTSVELTAKARAAYAFCDAYGPAPSAYLNPTNYSAKSARQHDTLEKLLQTMDGLATKNTAHKYLEQQRQRHGQVAFWAIAQALTFGQLSKAFGLFKQPIQQKIAKQYSALGAADLAKHLRLLVLFRNAAAHNECMFAHQTRQDCPDTALHAQLKIPKAAGRYTCGKRDLFAAVISLAHCLAPAEFATFATRLAAMIYQFTVQCAAISKPALLAQMGFPSNWEQIAALNHAASNA